MWLYFGHLLKGFFFEFFEGTYVTNTNFFKILLFIYIQKTFCFVFCRVEFWHCIWPAKQRSPNEIRKLYHKASKD